MSKSQTTRRLTRKATILSGFIGFTLLFSLTACGTNAPNVPEQPEIARVEVDPSAYLFTTMGESHTLTAKTFDKEGNPIEGPITWTSSESSHVSVEASGIIRANTEVGSAQIYAEVNGVRSLPVTVLVAQPAAGAVLVTDEQIVREPAPIDNTQPAGVGVHYAVTLQGVAVPEPGVVLLAKESAPLAGVVVSSTSSGDLVEVVLELRPLEELFERLSFRLSGTLDSTTTELDFAGYEQPAHITHTADGPMLTYDVELEPLATETFRVGPFTCKASRTQLSWREVFRVTSITITPSYRLDYDVDGDRDEQGFSFVRAKITGKLSVSLGGGIRLDARFNGSIDCRAEIMRVPIPVTGALSGFISPWLPYGARFAINGDVSYTALETSLRGTGWIEGTLGGEWRRESGWANLSNIDWGGDVDLRIRDPLHAEGSIGAALNVGVYGDLEFGNRFFSLGFLDITGGIVQDLKLARPESQARDRLGASKYELKRQVKAAPHSDITEALKLIFDENSLATVLPSITRLEVTAEVPLARSPTGRVTADRADFARGDTVTFTVTLSPGHVEYPLFGYNVQEVRIYRMHPGDNFNSTPVAVREASSGQTSFTLPWVADEPGAVAPEKFFAFVVTKLLPFAPLEVATVSDEICPASVDACPGASLTYTQTVTSQGQDRINENAEESSIRVTTVSATFQLRKLSETGSIETGGTIVFDIAGGVASYSESFEYRWRGGNEDLWGTCRYEAFTEEHRYSGSGSIPVSGKLQLRTEADGSYAIDRGPDTSFPDIPVNYSEDRTIRFVYHGSNPDCDADINESREFTEDEEWSLGGMNGTLPPGQPTVISGSTYDNRGDTIVEITWVLTLQ